MKGIWGHDFTKAPFGVTSAEVAIGCQDQPTVYSPNLPYKSAKCRQYTIHGSYDHVQGSHLKNMCQIVQYVSKYREKPFSNIFEHPPCSYKFVDPYSASRGTWQWNVVDHKVMK